MLTSKEKAMKLREAIALLMDVDCLQQAAMAEMDSDVSYELHIELEEIIDTLKEGVEELEAA
jgi:hypothetical protein